MLDETKLYKGISLCWLLCNQQTTLVNCTKSEVNHDANIESEKSRAFFCAVLAVFAAVALRQIGYHVNKQLDLFCIVLRSSIYIGLFAAWGISVSNRIIQPQVRRYLIVISVLMGFWIAVRGLRHSLDTCAWLMRYLWYLYYLPILFIPLLALFVAAALGKPDNLRLSKWMNLLYIPPAVLLLFVMTNDLHQLVFRFPEDAVVWMNDYRYGIVYFFAVGWMILCALTALVIMMVKCRVPHSRKVLVLPFVPIIMAQLYGVCYIFRTPWLRLIAGDMTVVFCLLFAAALESCIQCGLIQANTRYEELFSEAADIPAQITDNDYSVRYASKDAQQVPVEQMRAAEKEPIMLSDGKRLHNMPIHGGHVIWTEDMSELLSLREKLEDMQEELADRNGLLRLEYESEKELYVTLSMVPSRIIIGRQPTAQHRKNALLAELLKALPSDIPKVPSGNPMRTTTGTFVLSLVAVR